MALDMAGMEMVEVLPDCDYKVVIVPACQSMIYLQNITKIRVYDF